ncbi:fibronectin type III domain-containing protein [Dasania marina]|uniref:fibronectin type III domain-containing protein n=1 Tax=Dasania marina TaxID=471499 RepID=UPI00035FB72F|nr:fibronectin type III domain-containing protein [Dasania marina]
MISSLKTIIIKFLPLAKLFLVSWALMLSACGSGGGSGVGYQDDDLPPTANAEALGIPKVSNAPTKNYQTRSNSEVVLTGKDSDSDYAPILSFKWEQTEGPAVQLIERTASAVAFNTPASANKDTLGFKLTVTDANGTTASDEVFVDVIAVDDAGQLLEDPATPKSKLLLLAALREAEDTGANTRPFTVTVKTIAHWRNRLGKMDQMVVNTQRIAGLFPANFNPAASYNPLADPRNPLLTVDLVRFDADDINQHFEKNNRDRRVEAYEIPNAYLKLKITISSPAVVDFELLAMDNSPAATNVDTRQIIAINAIGTTIGAVAAANGALLQTWTSASAVELSTTNVRRQLGLDTALTANAYYNLLDPSGDLATLDGWLEHAGFIDAQGNKIDDPNIAHALYVNNYDLGFGRDMYLRKASNGNVYSYVVNYPTIEDGMQQKGDFAVVAMEYSENPDSGGANAKIVKFFAYVPDERTGENIRVSSLNFDGNGERFIPGACTICHQSHPGDRDFTNIADADLNATFIPWDLDSFLYSHANNAQLIEPTLNSDNFTDSEIKQYSRESQEKAFRKLNLGALATYKDDPTRHEASIALVHGWYGDSAMSYAVDKLPNSNFDGEYVPVGWQGQEDLYHNVFTRTCRICHTQLADKNNNYDSYAKVLADKDQVIARIYEMGKMPGARLSMDRFWVPLTAGADSSATLLREHLMGLGDTVPLKPMFPVPAFSVNLSTPDINELIIVEASDSVFSESYQWSMVSPSGSSSQLNNTGGLMSSFIADMPGGSYDITLTTTNAYGAQASITQSVVINDKVPVAECFTANSSGLYSSIGLSNISVVALLSDLGDGGVSIDSVVDDTYGSASIEAGGQTISYQLNDPFVRGVDVIEYQVADFDGSLSTTSSSANCISSAPAAGFGSIIIDSTPSGTLAASNVTATVDATANTTEIDIAWSAVTGISNVDGYNVYRNATATGSPLNGSSLITGTSFTDNDSGDGLEAGQTYDYSVETVVGAFSSNPSTASASTASLTPTNLEASNDGSSTADETTISLTWEVPEAGEKSIVNYTVYRDPAFPDTTITTTDANRYSDTSLNSGTTYTYTVTANDVVQESPLSNSATQSTRPLAPSGLTLTPGNDSRSDINLSWNAAGGNFDAYMVYRDDIKISPVPKTQTNYSDTNRASDTSYSYYVTTVSDNGGSLEKESAVSDNPGVSYTTDAATAAEATNLTAIIDNINDATEINLSWGPPVAFTDEGYNIYRSKDGAAAELLVTVPAGSTSYTDSNLKNSSTYQYQIEAIYTSAEPGKEPRLTAQTALATDTTLSLTPTALTEDAATISQVDFHWTTPVAKVDRNFVIERRVNGGTFASLTTVACCSVSDNTVSPATNYSYSIKARQGIDSATSIINITTQPNDPSGLSATTISTSQINLSWSAAAGNVDSYYVYRDGVNVANVSAPTVSYSNTGLSSGTDYSYTVRAVYNSVESNDTVAATATTTPAAPTSFTASDGTSTTQIDLSWTSPGGDIDSYNIYRDGTLATTVTAPTVTYTDTRSSGNQYSYTVTAVAGGHESAAAADTGATQPAAPTTISATVNSASQITVASYAVSCNNTASYIVKPSGLRANASTTAASDAVSGLTGNKAYTFTVTASCNGISSAASAASASVTTDVSYADNIAASNGDGAGEGLINRVRGTVGDTNTCASCHSEGTIKSRISLINSSYTCIETNIQTCSASMGPSGGGGSEVTPLSASEIDIIKAWIRDGQQ